MIHEFRNVNLFVKVHSIRKYWIYALEYIYDIKYIAISFILFLRQHNVQKTS